MLAKSDTEIVKTWLRGALDAGAKRGLSAKELAERCTVTVQAVNGWLSTGRITKKNLEVAARYFGHGPSFIEPTKVRESAPDPWPFRKITPGEIRGLKPKQMLRLEKLMRDRLDEWLEDANGGDAGKKRSA